MAAASKPGINETQAKAAAARITGAQPVVAVQLVERLDGGDNYYLVATGQEGREGWLVAVNQSSGAVTNSAQVAKLHAVWLTQKPATNAQLVWAPSRISQSPLYPFWRVAGSPASYIDHAGTVWHDIPSAGPG